MRQIDDRDLTLGQERVHFLLACLCLQHDHSASGRRPRTSATLSDITQGVCSHTEALADGCWTVDRLLRNFFVRPGLREKPASDVPPAINFFRSRLAVRDLISTRYAPHSNESASNWIRW